jgi:acyl carrier protein
MVTGYILMLFGGLFCVGLLAFFIVALVKAFTRKTTGWIVTAVVMGLLGLATILGSAATAIVKMSRLDSDGAKLTKVLTSKEGGHQITVPATWISMPNLNSQAEIGAGNGLKEHYVIVLIEDKATVGADLGTYMKFTADRMTASLEQGHQGDLSELTISGYPAQRRRITGRSKGAKSMNVVYLHTCIETDRHLVQILFWTLAGREDAAIPVFEKVAATFRATGKAKPEDATAPANSVKAATTPGDKIKGVQPPADHVRQLMTEQLGVDRAALTDGSRLKEDLGADDLDVVELVMAIEEEFQVSVPDEVAEKWQSTGDIIRWVETHGPKKD